MSRRAASRPWPFVGVAVALVAVSLALASTLTIRSSFQELLPADVASVGLIKELQRRVGGDGNVLVVVESLEGPSGLGRAEALATELSREFLAMGPTDVRSVEWEMSSTRDWFASHWPLFASVGELTDARDAARAEVRRRALDANPLGISLEDEEDAPPLPPVIDPEQPSPRRQIEERFDRFLDGFMVHPDRSSVTVVVRPAGTALGIDESRALLARMRAVVDRHGDELRAGHLRVGFAGTFPMFIADYQSIVADVGLTGLITSIIVLLSMILFFRDLRSTAALGLCVATAVAVNFGLARLTIGYLNTQTAFLGSIVAGDGLNYGLIYLARVRQLRRMGVTLVAACEDAARTTAVGTFLASMATSVSFATLVFAANRGFRHFGIIGGVGMMLCWLATFTLAPALLSLFERVRPVRPSPGNGAVSRGTALAGRIFARPTLVLVSFSTAVLAAGAVFVSRLPTAMEHNLENLTNEPSGTDELRRDHARAQDSLGRSIAGAVALLDSREQADAYCASVRERMKDPRVGKLIQSCETLSSVVPAQQPEKLALLAQIRFEITDRRLSRLSPALRARLLEIREDLAAQRTLSDADAPPALLDRFRERDGSVGRIAVLAARPDAQLELGPNLKAFAAGARQLPVGGALVDATGENIVFADL
ncbi:MAG: MMPL family transporter, partial [Myxococcales bacterium]